jgi:MerR family transcriptional regulator, copper efflux regulator
MKIAEFEIATGISRDTLRYYEKIGLLTPPTREANSYRCYGKAQTQELNFIERGKALGFTLLEIKRGLETYRISGKLCAEFREQLISKKNMLSKRMLEDAEAITEIENLLRDKY